MNELPQGFEDLPIGFIQALFEFYRAYENINPEYNIGDIPLKNIEPGMRSAIIKGDYIAYDVKPVTPIQPSEIFNFGEAIGLERDTIFKIMTRKYGKSN